MTRYQGQHETVFSHDRLDVYRVAVDFARWLHEESTQMSRGHASLRDQIQRAAESVVLNIAEGAQQRTVPMAKKHYRVALGSAAECAAALDLMELYGATRIDDGRVAIRRVGAMLRKMAR
jgi:four helix bundle protein